MGTEAALTSHCCPVVLAAMCLWPLRCLQILYMGLSCNSGRKLVQSSCKQPFMREWHCFNSNAAESWDRHPFRAHCRPDVFGEERDETEI